ncbi:MAG: hypothetical protein HY840_07185 [Bacteroidetes bacterium]|nr:hypothetical protein [Bacteroidota bacterium]
MQKPTSSPQPRVAASANPNLSVIGDFRGLYRNFGHHNFDAVLHETEFSFQSVVDPYARADFFYSVKEDHATGEFSSEVEEGYLTTLSLPAHLQLRAGRFKQTLGRINPVHPHALSFVDMPDAYVNFFGEEGLKGDGASLSWLLPNHVFFQELTVEATNVAGESPSFERSKTNNFIYLAHFKNFWDLSANATLELGISGISGENRMKKITNIGAVVLTYKWKPVRYNTYKSVTFQNELYYSRAMLDSSTVNAIGFYSLLNVQIAKRTFVAGRFDYSNRPNSAQFLQQSGSLALGWLATEFQKIEIEGKYTTMNEALPENNNEKSFVQVYLRWIFVIGSHGAHVY